MKTTKTLFIAALAMFGMVLMTSCDSEKLSKRLAKNAIENHWQFADSALTTTLTTGYYEINEDAETQLRQLEKAGVIVCKIDKVIEKKKRWRYRGWSTETYYEDVEHKFASVELTQEGRKYEVTNVHQSRKEIEKAMRLFEKEKEVTLPDYMNTSIPAEKSETEAAAEDDEEAEVDTVWVEDYEEIEEPVAKQSSAPVDPYKAALDKVNRTNHNMLAGKYKIAEVLDVICPEDDVKAGKGSCLFAFELVKPTPFGWVIVGADTFNKRHLMKAEFYHTLDNGWVLRDINNE